MAIGKQRAMKNKILKVVIAASLVIIASAVATKRIEAKSPKQNKHDRIVKFWTNARIARAIPRDFVRNPQSRSYKPIQWKNSANGVPTATTWTGGGEVSTSTGKVFFQMGKNYYVCSASVITENAPSRSIVLTAAHCAFDEVNKAFAINWLFIPKYYEKPIGLNPDASFCKDTSFGCWTASALVVSNEYANAGAFNDTAVKHDYAFGAMGPGGKSGTDDLSQIVGSHAISITSQSDDIETWIFGYPAANRYKGNKLMFCNGPLGFDSRMMYETYSLPCSLSAGSSGGPWFSPFASTGTSKGSGTQFSVNSYTYGGSKAMHGPKFTSETEEMYVAAKTANANLQYSKGS